MALLEYTDEKPDKTIEKAVRAAIADAEANFAPLKFEGEYPVSGIGISELRPYHVENTTLNIPQTSNLNYWQTSQLTGSTWSDWINVTLDKDLYIVVTGIFDLEATPNVTEVAPSANGLDLPVVNVEQSFGLQEARVWFPKPFVVKPDNVLRIQLYGRTATPATTSERIGLMGYAIAKRSKLITRS